MKGTEKQIAWANEIRERVVSNLETVVIPMMRQAVAAGKGPEAVLRQWEHRLETVRNFDGSAGDMIEMFRLVEGDAPHQARAIAAAYQVNKIHNLFD